MNPQVLVGADGIEVVRVGGGRKTVTAEELRRALVDLPLSAWPYGRVVLVQDPGVQSRTRSDDEGIRRNHDAVEKILKALDIVGDWWPPA